MAKDIILGGFFVASSDMTGKPGLTVTIDVWRVALADLAKSEIVTAGSATEIGDGVYAYRVASADLQTYEYFGVFKTSDTSVAQKHVAAVMLDFADAPSIVSLVWSAATRTLTAISDSAGVTTLLTRIVGTLLTGNHNPQTGDAYARLGAPAGASVSADIASNATSLATLTARLGAFTGTGLNTVLGFLRALARKTTALTPSDMGGTYDNTTDSLEAIKDAGASAAIADADMTEIAERVWDGTYAPTRTLTQSAAQVAAALAGSDLTLLRGDTVTIALTGLGNVSSRTALYFTVKSNLQAADSDAVIQVTEAGGLVVLNGRSMGITASDASLVVTNAATGAVSITLKPNLTKNLTVMPSLKYDVQMVTASGVTTLTRGDAQVTADVTRSVT